MMSRPALVDDFRVACDPHPECDVCQALAAQLQSALRAGDLKKASSRAREIRQCDHPKGQA